MTKKTGINIWKLAKRKPFVVFGIGLFVWVAVFFILELLIPEAFASMLGGAIFLVWYHTFRSVAPPFLFLGLFFLVVAVGCKLTDLAKKRKVRKLRDESKLSYEETAKKPKIEGASHIAEV